MSSSSKAIIVLIILVLGEGTWIYFHDSRLNPKIKDTEQAYRDSIAGIHLKYDSLSKSITVKDHKYDSLQQVKQTAEYHAYERIVYIDKSTVTYLDKFIRSAWDTSTTRQREVLHY